jgi:YgiT-type zinc finger domain-containing protein
MVRITTCPSCGSKRIKRVRRTWTGVSQKETYSVPDLEYYDCPDCGEKAYEPEAMRRIEEHSPTYRKTHVKKRSA